VAIPDMGVPTQKGEASLFWGSHSNSMINYTWSVCICNIKHYKSLTGKFLWLLHIPARVLTKTSPVLGGSKIVDLLLVGPSKSGLLRLPYGNIQPGNRVFGQRSEHPGGGLLHPAFGVEQKGAGKGDPLTGGQLLKDFHPVTGTPADLNLLRIEDPLMKLGDREEGSLDFRRPLKKLIHWRITGHRGRRYRSSCPRIRRRMMAADQSGLPAGRYASGSKDRR